MFRRKTLEKWPVDTAISPVFTAFIFVRSGCIDPSPHRGPFGTATFKFYAAEYPINFGLPHKVPQIRDTGTSPP